MWARVRIAKRTEKRIAASSEGLNAQLELHASGGMYPCFPGIAVVHDGVAEVVLVMEAMFGVVVVGG